MKPGRLVLKSLLFYWRPYLAAAAGLTLASAVTVGALVVSDSVKSTIRHDALGRLGAVRYALASPRFVPADREPNAAPALILRGTVARDANVAVVTDVQVLGVDEWFGKAYGAPMPFLGEGECALNARLAEALGAHPGEDVLLSVPVASQAPASSLFGRKRLSDLRAQIRVKVARVLPDAGIGGFALAYSPRPPKNAFVNLRWLARQLGEPGTCNAFVASGPAPPRFVPALSDLGVADKGGAIHYDRLVFPAGLLEAIVRTNPRAETGAVYLADRIAAPSGRSSSYAVIGSRSSLKLGPEEIVLTRWLADDLGACVGSTLQVEWLQSLPDGGFERQRAKLRVARILPEGHLEPAWTPDFKGITNATTIDTWDPPFPFDPKRVTPRDEAFWKRWRAAPKAWVGQQLMDRMWGALTVTTVARADKLDPRELANAEGLAFQAVREQALAAAEGSTDFAGLFLGLGAFVIASGLAFGSGTLRLALARRAKQFGLMAACGVPLARVRLWVGAEGAALALLGALTGTFAGAAYAWAVVGLLNTGWSAAVGSAPVRLFVSWRTFAAGFGASLLITLATTAFAVRSLSRRPALALLMDRPAEPALEKRKAGARAALALGAFGIAAAAAAAVGGTPARFFAAGALCLVSGLFLFRAALAAAGQRETARPTLGGLALKNLAARRGQALLVAGLLACASFALTAVAANARRLSPEALKAPESGSGGFSLILSTHTGLPCDLNSAQGRQRLGLPDDPTLETIRAVPFLMHEGDDASCLNLAKPQSPTVLGILEPERLRGRFRAEGKPLWALGGRPSGEIEAAADSETAQWILRTGLGRTLQLGPAGQRAKVVSLVRKSLFAREVLVGGQDFKRLFPGNDLPRYFLIETSRPEQAAKLLIEGLAEYGPKVERVDRLIAEFMGVQNAYIQAFLALGGLGLALGAFGLASALLRNVAERRKELALLSACGLRRSSIAKMLFVENAGLLAAGIAWGTASALLAVFKTASGTIGGAWVGLAMGLAMTLALGAGAVWAAIAGSLRGSLVSALRSE